MCRFRPWGSYWKDMNKIIMTQEGLDSLKIEYKDLTEVKRREVAQKIKDAVALGDLSENGEYDSARDQQAEIEGRILELNEILKRVEISDSVNMSTVSVGSKIKVKIASNEFDFHLVGAPEADPSMGKISHESPIGKALLGSKKGDVVEVHTPSGVVQYTIITIF